MPRFLERIPQLSVEQGPLLMRSSQVRLLFPAPRFASKNKELGGCRSNPLPFRADKNRVSKDGFSQDFPKQMSGMLPLLREMFPGKLMLTVEDVARELGRAGAGAYVQTRELLANGVIVPCLRKMGGQRLVPIAAWRTPLTT